MILAFFHQAEESAPIELGEGGRLFLLKKDIIYHRIGYAVNRSSSGVTNFSAKCKSEAVFRENSAGKNERLQYRA